MVLEGSLTFWMGDVVHHLRAGDTLALPRGVPHAHVVTSEEAHVLTLAMPAGFEQLFLDLGVPVLEGATPPAPDIAAMGEAVARLGVRTVGPPPTLDAATRRPGA